MLIPKSLAPIVAAVSKEATRFSMNGVHVSRTKEGLAKLQATNGRTAIVATWNDEPDAITFPTMLPGDRAIDAHGRSASPLREILPAGAFKDAMAAAPKSKHKPILANVVLEETTANGTVRLVATDLSRVHDAITRTIDGEYPDVLAVLPTKRKFLACVNPRLLGETLLAVAKMLEAEEPDDDGLTSVNIEVAPTKPWESPIVITGRAGKRIDIIAAVMPVSGDDVPPQGSV